MFVWWIRLVTGYKSDLSGVDSTHAYLVCHPLHFACVCTAIARGDLAMSKTLWRLVSSVLCLSLSIFLCILIHFPSVSLPSSLMFS